MLSQPLYFLRLSVRHMFKKQLGYTVINIAGLAIGFSSFLIAGIYAYDELTYDQFHPNSEHIYRLAVDWDGDGIKRNWARTSVPVGAVGDGEIPDIENIVRIRKNPGTDLFVVGNQPHYESQMLMVDQNFFSLFGFELERGEADKVLEDKYSIVLTTSTAARYFGNQDPIGNVIKYDGKFDLKVTGIATDPPSQSHIQFDCLVSFSLLEEMFNETRLNHWGQFDHYTYLGVNSNATSEEVETKMAAFLKSKAPDWVNEKITLTLQPIHSIHLESQRNSELGVNSNITYSIVFISAATLILFVAILNFINLSTAIYLTRAKEIVMRKILGSSKRNLFRTLILESLLTSILALLIAWGIVSLAIPEVSQMSGKSLHPQHSLSIIMSSIIMSVLVGLISGIFPVIKLIGHRKLTLTEASQSGKTILSNVMVLSQLVVSSLLIIAMLGVSKQLSFLQNTSLGYEDNNVLIIPIKDRSHNARYQSTLNQLKAIPGIQSASFSSSIPSANNYLTYTYKISGANRTEAALTTVILDENYFDLYEIKLKKGRLPNGKASTEQTQIVLNQAAVNFFELDEPIGKTVTGKTKGTIVGVVENFQVGSLHNTIEPLIMYNYLPTLRFISVRPEHKFTPEIIDQISAFWSSVYVEYPLEFSYLNDDKLRLYSFERGVTFSLNLLVLIAIFLSVIGLIGHATLLRRQKAREYSIRKILGGSSLTILLFSFKRLAPIISIFAFLVTVIGYFGLDIWLRNFAFRISVDASIFLVPIISMILLLILLVGGLLFNQLNKPPVKYLGEL